jgi:hypothetical protein
MEISHSNIRSVRLQWKTTAPQLRNNLYSGDMKNWGVVATIALLVLTGCSSPEVAEPADPEMTAAGDTVIVPDVVGQQGDAAKAAIEAVGLQVGWSETVLKASNWTVDTQSPTAGSEAIAGGKVRLTVTRPTPTAAASDPTHLTLSGLSIPFAFTARS